MNIKTVAVTAAIFLLFALEAVAQTNHNTTRSNKTSGEIAAPADTNVTPADSEISRKIAKDEGGVADGISAVNRPHIKPSTDAKPSNDLKAFCNKFSKAEKKAARKACRVVEVTETYTVCGCTHL